MVGTKLRQAREAKGTSVGRISERTKISVHILRAIDSEDFTCLPGGLVRRGYLRAYAREVGLDPEETVRRYLVEFGVPPALDPEAVVASGDPSVEMTAPKMETLERRMQRGQWMGSAVVLLVGAVVYSTAAREHDALSGQPLAVPTQTADTSGARVDIVPLDQVASASTSPLHFEIQPGGPCWVAAVADGRQALQRLMNAGDREVVDANDEATLRVGDAAACAFSINGAAARPVGAAAGQPATFHITRANYQEFVARPAAAMLPPAPRSVPQARPPAVPEPAVEAPASVIAAPSTAPASEPPPAADPEPRIEP
jgi:hypothetical protein